jgi:signal transduction histidine kinase
MNPALYETLGKPKDMKNMSFLEYFSDDCRVKAENVYNNEILESEGPFINEFFISKGNESYQPMETNTSIINYEGKPAILSFFRNIGERKHMEYLLDYLVREINGRNQIVISNIEKLISSRGDKKGVKPLKIVLSNLFANANTIKKAYKLLQVSQGEKELISLDPREKINDAIKAVMHQFPERDVQINTHFMGLLPNILADEFIEDVFYILIENSVEFTEGKVVEIDIFAKANSIENPTYVEIKIEDHSGGISDDEKEKIFQRLMNSKEGVGTGFGLSIAKFVLKRYSGELGIEDRIIGDPSKGRLFRLMLPTVSYLK